MLVGLSGGIDSAVVAAIAVDALGAENVQGVSMPGPYSSEGSKDDAKALASRTWASSSSHCPSADVFDAYRKALGAGVRRARPKASRKKIFRRAFAAII